jgi:crossover junction endodeoxyribonuclease RusA
MTQPTLLGSDTVEFFVPGKPAPQGSKRAFRNQHSGRIQLTESSKTVGPWRERVALTAHNEMGGRPLMGGAVSVLLDFVLPRPTSTPKTRATPPAVKKPDLDKLARAVLDAITDVVIADDSQVTNLHATKRLAEIGETAGVHIRVEEA